MIWDEFINSSDFFFYMKINNKMLPDAGWKGAAQITLVETGIWRFVRLLFLLFIIRIVAFPRIRVD
jgi:hypothetical protein